MIVNASDELSLANSSQRLEELRRRLLSSLAPARTVKISHPAEVRVLRQLSREELEQFARSCHANAVSRSGGEQYDFSYASWE